MLLQKWMEDNNMADIAKVEKIENKQTVKGFLKKNSLLNIVLYINKNVC